MRTERYHIPIFDATDHPMFTDPRDPKVTAPDPGPRPPAHLFDADSIARAIEDNRLQRAAYLEDLWQRDRHGFDIDAPYYINMDPPLIFRLSLPALTHAAVLIYRQKQGARS